MMLIALLLASAAQTSPNPTSGEYGQLKLAFADGRVTGAFNETRIGNGTEAAPQFSCGFALAGAWRDRNGTAEVLTWWPGDNPPDERIRGQLTVRGGTATLKLNEDPGGCSMTGESFKDTPFSEQLRTHRPWLEVREVSRARAHLSDTPGGPPRRGYVTRGDIVGVIGRTGAFARVQYVDGRQPVEGWLPLTELAPPAP